MKANEVLHPAARKVRRPSRSSVGNIDMKRMRIFIVAALSLLVMGRSGWAEYEYWDTDAYRALSRGDQIKLDQAHADFHLLWGALDRYADMNAGAVPASLDELVPGVLKELPADPFATAATATQTNANAYASSKQGWGYQYLRAAPNRRSWVLKSVGLPEFPYLAPAGNHGLFVAKGFWSGGACWLPYDEERLHPQPPTEGPAAAPGAAADAQADGRNGGGSAD